MIAVLKLKKKDFAVIEDDKQKQGGKLSKPNSQPLARPSHLSASAPAPSKPASDSYQGVEEGVLDYARQVDESIRGFNTDVVGAIQGFMYHSADQTIEALQGAEGHYYDRLSQRLKEVKVDPEGFRERGAALKSRLFESFGISS